MDGNKDESERCIQIAERRIKEGEYEQAVKFLRKADKLYPSAAAQNLIEEIESALNERRENSSNRKSESRENSTPHYTNGTTNEPDASGDAPSATRRRSSGHQQSNGTAGSEKSRTTSPALEYSVEQVEAVRKIKKCKDYYEILAIEKESADVEIKKAYKKLALQFHPDKNSAPGAADAFKMIGNAFAVLSDPQKKKQYDLYGAEDQVRSNVRTYDRYYTNDYTRGFEAEISPEDLFNMFFGTGNLYTETQFRRQRYQRPAAQHHAHTTHETGGYGAIVQMMPVIILITLSLMSSLFVSEPAYSLVRNNKYLYERKTTNLEVPYFVKENFEREYKGNIRRIEAHVEEDFITNLRASCFRERNYKENMIWRARNFRDMVMEEKAKSLKTPSCDRLQKVASLV